MVIQQGDRYPYEEEVNQNGNTKETVACKDRFSLI